MEPLYGYGEGRGPAGVTGWFSSSTVKLFGIVTMFIDHFALAILARMEMTSRLYTVYYSMRMIGRIGFPIFCFLLVEGFQKTSNKSRYALRLAVFSLLSEVPFDLAFGARVLEFDHQNVYFTLLFGMLAMCSYDFLMKTRSPELLQWAASVAGAVVFGMFVMKQRPVTLVFEEQWENVLLFAAVCAALFLGLFVYGGRYAKEERMKAGLCLASLSAFVWIAEFMKTDYSGMGVLTITAVYIFRRNHYLSMMWGCIVLTLMSFNEITSFFALIPAAGYNGRRGLKLKYFFYFFYPCHLLLLWLLACLMGRGDISVF